MAEARNFGDERRGRRIADRIDPLADPFAVDQAFVFEKGGIGEFHGGLRVRRLYRRGLGR
jgi:hypothetical protein